MTRSVHVAILEAYHGGSHAAFVRALTELSRHRITVATLPARKWKWRMRGAAIWLARDGDAWIRQSVDDPIDVILCSDMLSVADLRALLPPRLRNVPIVCYFHENQLTYPIPEEQTRDFQYGMTNITSCLAADLVLFNTASHLEDFLAAAGDLLRKMPDYVPATVIEEIRAKVVVCPPPITFEPLRRPEKAPGAPLTILWCHRWEADKNPEPFFEALARLDESKCAFDLVLIGEQFRTAPLAFARVCERLRQRIRHVGHLVDSAEYARVLAQCDLVVSTARQETFGVAVVEAILAGCQPLLTNRLSYPEIIPAEFHPPCLFAPDASLFVRLRDLLAGHGRLTADQQRRLQESLTQRYSAGPAVSALDEALGRAAAFSV